MNCYIERELLNNFEDICYMMGRTKTRILETAMRAFIAPYLDDETKTIDIRDGYYIDRRNGKNVRQMCKIISNCNKYSKPHVRIYKDGQMLIVPKDCVEEK